MDGDIGIRGLAGRVGRTGLPGLPGMEGDDGDVGLPGNVQMIHAYVTKYWSGFFNFV